MPVTVINICQSFMYSVWFWMELCIECQFKNHLTNYPRYYHPQHRLYRQDLFKHDLARGNTIPLEKRVDFLAKRNLFASRYGIPFSPCIAQKSRCKHHKRVCASARVCHPSCTTFNYGVGATLESEIFHFSKPRVPGHGHQDRHPAGQAFRAVSLSLCVDLPSSERVRGTDGARGMFLFNRSKPRADVALGENLMLFTWVHWFPSSPDQTRCRTWTMSSRKRMVDGFFARFCCCLLLVVVVASHKLQAAQRTWPHPGWTLANDKSKRRLFLSGSEVKLCGLLLVRGGQLTTHKDTHTHTHIQERQGEARRKKVRTEEVKHSSHSFWAFFLGVCHFFPFPRDCFWKASGVPFYRSRTFS